MRNVARGPVAFVHGTPFSGDYVGKAIVHGAILAVSCEVSFWLITHILRPAYFISKTDNLLGGMWAVIATVYVYHDSYERSVSAAFLRMAATSVSFALCLAYLLLFPFHAWGMAVLIGAGAIIVTLMGQPDASVTTGITTAVIMVVAAMGPPKDAWRQPFLRMADTAVGIVVGVAFARIAVLLYSRSPDKEVS